MGFSRQEYWSGLPLPTSVWDECNCVVVWTFFGIAFLWGWNENWPFPLLWHIECSTSKASSFRIWNSSNGISSPPLALFIVMLSKAHLSSHSRVSGSRWVITPSALLTIPKPLTVWITTSCGKLFKRGEYHIWPASWEICMQVKKKQLELNLGQQTGSKLGKE